MPLTKVKLSSWETYRNVYINTLSEIYTAEKEGIIFVSGRLRVNDGEGGIYKYETTFPRSSDNGTSIIDPTQSGNGNGCWVRQKFFASPEGTNFNEVQTATAGQTDFGLTTFTYTPGEGALAVYVNGTRLTPNAFTEVDSTHVQLASPISAGDVVEFIGHERPHSGSAVSMAALAVSYTPATSGLVSTNVQRAIDEVVTMIGTGGGGTGGASNANLLAYAPLAPDLSTNVQDGMHWIQNQVFNHLQALQNAHEASAIHYRNSVSALTVDNAQDAIDAVWRLATQKDLRQIPYAGSITTANNAYQALEDLHAEDDRQRLQISNHIGATANAHAARVISYVSTLQLYQNITNVDQALTAVAVKLANHVHAAVSVTYDHKDSSLQAVEVKGALDELDTNLATHKAALNSGHSAQAITYSPIGGMTSTDMKGAIDEIYNKAQNHIDDATAAHAGTAISFNGVRYSLASTDVEAAIIEAMTKRRMYQGHLDLTQPMPLNFTPTADSNYTTSAAGAVDPSWNALFIGTPPVAVVAGDYLLATSTNLYHLGTTVPNQGDFVLQNPATGIAQGIIVQQLTDTALRLSRIAAGAGSPLLDVVGDSVVDFLRSRSTVEDVAGNLRQDAGDVVFDPTAIQVSQPGFIAADVQAAIDTLYITFGGLLGNTGKIQIPSGSISVTPGGNITSTDVAAALLQLDTLLTQHIQALAAHPANHITFDNTTNGFTAAEVQAAIEEIPRMPAGGAAGDVLAKIDGTDFNTTWANKISLGTF